MHYRILQPQLDVMPMLGDIMQIQMLRLAGDRLGQRPCTVEEGQRGWLFVVAGDLLPYDVK